MVTCKGSSKHAARQRVRLTSPLQHVWPPVQSPQASPSTAHVPTGTQVYWPNMDLAHWEPGQHEVGQG